jgi:hypothetical protein
MAQPGRQGGVDPTGGRAAQRLALGGQSAELARPDVHPDLIDGELVHIPFADPSVRGSSLSLIARRHAGLSPAALLVADTLKEQLLHLAGR